MKKINIKGRDYIEVNERIMFFRKNFKNWSIESEIINYSPETVMIKATIKDPEGVIKATGHASEDRNSSYINKTSFIENCETSAWGRALAAMGVGIDSSIASYDEVKNAIDSEKKPQASKTKSKPKKKLTMDEVKKASEMIKDGKYKKEYFADNYALTTNQKKILEIC